MNTAQVSCLTGYAFNPITEGRRRGVNLQQAGVLAGVDAAAHPRGRGGDSKKLVHGERLVHRDSPGHGDLLVGMLADLPPHLQCRGEEADDLRHDLALFEGAPRMYPAWHAM
ncbi:hypothetical protein [Streptomyces griseoluteus]|uniref:hypothetical protein n=1 Tax=Streptomyces griseoluteus TaxID=29306 RepID=UPI0034410FFE